MNRFTHTLPEELRRAAQEAPDQPFIRMLQGEWSFRQVDDGSSRLAAGLQPCTRPWASYSRIPSGA